MRKGARGEVVDSKGVTLEGGASATILFELTRGEGVYEVEMEGFTESFTVNPKPSFWDEIPVFPIAMVLLVVLALILRARLRAIYEECVMSPGAYGGSRVLDLQIKKR